jgi:hypothetical protein
VPESVTRTPERAAETERPAASIREEPARIEDAEPPKREPSQDIPTSQTPPSAISGVITVDLLHDLWPKIRLDVKARDRRIEALLSSCDPAMVNGSSIVLVTNYKFHLEKMNEDVARELVEGVIGRLVNQAVSVRTEMRGTSAPSHSNGTLSRPHVTNDLPAERTDTGVAASPTPERSENVKTVLEAAKNIFDADEITPRS